MKIKYTSLILCVAISLPVCSAELITFKSGDVATASAFNSNFENLNSSTVTNTEQVELNKNRIDVLSASLTSIPRLQLHIEGLGVIGNIIQGDGNVNQLRALVETDNEFFSLNGSSVSLGDASFSDSDCSIPVANNRKAVFKGLGKKVIVAYIINSKDLVVIDSNSTLVTLDTIYNNRVLFPHEEGYVDETPVCVASAVSPESSTTYFTAKVMPRPSYFEDKVAEPFILPNFVGEVEIRFGNTE